jgi:hypothetical protein
MTPHEETTVLDQVSASAVGRGSSPNLIRTVSPSDSAISDLGDLTKAAEAV